MNKYLIQIPTVQFGLISTEIAGTHDQAVEEHNALLKAYQGDKTGAGLPGKEWNQWLDTYLTSNTGDADLYQAMSLEQKNIIQEIKKSVKRIKSKIGE